MERDQPGICRVREVLVKAQDRKILLRDATIPAEARFIIDLIDTWADKNGENAYPSTERLILICGWSPNTFWKWFKVAKRTGYLTVRKIRGSKGFSKNQYTVKIKGQSTPKFCGTTKSHLPANDSLLVESEAILRALPDPDRLREDSPQYG